MQIELDPEAGHVPVIALVVGSLAVALGVVERSLLPASAGAALILAAPFPWWTRRLALVSETGVRFHPSLFYGRHSLTWAEVRQWWWERGVTSLGEGDAEWKLLVLVLPDGTEKKLPEPYCNDRLDGELIRRVGAAMPRGRDKVA